MKTLLIATQNEGKYREILEVLDGLPCRFLSLKDVDLDESVLKNFQEDGETFEENSRKKAEYFAKHTGFVTLGEDSGVLVDALPKELGVHTRRWGAGGSATDEEWISHFLERMKDVPYEKRGAKFVCAATVWKVTKSQGNFVTFSGETRGVITQTLEAPIYKGLPLSSCFRPDGFDKVYSALLLWEKNRVSHRGKALMQVKNFLEKNL